METWFNRSTSRWDKNLPLRMRKARKYRTRMTEMLSFWFMRLPHSVRTWFGCFVREAFDWRGKPTPGYMKVSTSGSYRNQLEGSLLLKSFFITNFQLSYILLCGNEGLPPVRLRQQRGQLEQFVWPSSVGTDITQKPPQTPRLGHHDGELNFIFRLFKSALPATYFM